MGKLKAFWRDCQVGHQCVYCVTSFFVFNFFPRRVRQVPFARKLYLALYSLLVSASICDSVFDLACMHACEHGCTTCAQRCIYMRHLALWQCLLKQRGAEVVLCVTRKTLQAAFFSQGFAFPLNNFGLWASLSLKACTALHTL